MTTRLLVTCLLVTTLLPATARAAAISFHPVQPTAGWKVLHLPGGGEGQEGSWDRRSYDSKGNPIEGACTAASLVGGGTCDWNAPGGVTPLTMPGHANPALPIEYFGVLSAGGADAVTNFYFTGGLPLGWEVLFQLTAWDTNVEFGWYEAGNPDARHPLMHAAGAPRKGEATIPTHTEFGFYYRNARFASGDVLYFTESAFNVSGGYLDYFQGWQHDGLSAAFEDELAFVPQASDSQQFILFRQGDRYWLGLEDQLGRPTSVFCNVLADQPCADYDFNDLVIGWQEQPVPESASLVLLSAGLLTAAWRFRRRPR